MIYYIELKSFTARKDLQIEAKTDEEALTKSKSMYGEKLLCVYDEEFKIIYEA